MENVINTNCMHILKVENNYQESILLKFWTLAKRIDNSFSRMIHFKVLDLGIYL